MGVCILLLLPEVVGKGLEPDVFDTAADRFCLIFSGDRGDDTGFLTNDLLKVTFLKLVVPAKLPASIMETSGRVVLPFSITR